MTQATLPAFAGAPEERALAQDVFEIMVGFGMAYARGALIRQTVSNLATYLSQGGRIVTPPQIDAVVRANPDVFARVEQDDQIIISTTKEGRSGVRGPDLIHTFKQRLYEPEHPLSVDDINNVVTLVKPVIQVVEPVQISPYWRGHRTTPTAPADTPAALPHVPVDLPVVETPAALPVAPVQPASAQSPTSPTSIVLSDGTVVDLRLPLDQLVTRYGDPFQAEVRAALNDDPLKRVVNFGAYYYPADALRPFGKNDLRRIREFILEQREPVPDGTIMTDLYRERAGSANYELACFALDYRLVRERDFEFVGVPGVHLWSAKGLPALGTKRLKASDLGQLYSFLQDGYGDEVEAVEGLLEHTLTFFEWEYGVLPLDAAMEALMPPPLLHDQRTAIIRIESSQHYGTNLCELRFPTGTRGGWLWGLEDFFHEYLVPGVTITLAATEDPTVFAIQYEEAPAVEDKLLRLDEKRNRFAFVSNTYYARTDDRFLPSQSNFGKLRNLKPLPINERKKAETVLVHVFETVGEQLGSKEEPLYWLHFDELLLAINVLRPMSRTYLQHLLSNDDLFYADETTVGAYFYKPLPEEAEAEPDDDQDTGGVLSYDEDEE